MSGNVVQLRKKTDAPPLDFDDGRIGVELELDTAEQPVLVDDPTTGTVGWMAERRSRLADAPPVIPAWLRDRRQVADGARFLAAYYGRTIGFHAARAPVYGARLWGRAPYGAARLVGRWRRWVTYAVADDKRAESKGEEWLRAEERLRAWKRGRRRTSTAAAVPATVLIVLAYLLLPAWMLTAAAAGIVTLLGVAGRRPDRPIVRRYVYVHQQRRLESTEVEEALAAIGIKGRVDWVAPICVDGPGWRAELDLPGATTADKVLDKRQELAAAMRRPVATIWPDTDRDAHPGRLVLWVAREDPAKAKRRLWPLMHAGQADVFEPLPVGFDPRGTLASITLMYSNLLVGGIPGSGKTSWALVIALGAALDPTAALWVYELKGSGDLDAVRPVCHRYVSGDDEEDLDATLDGLRAGIAEYRRRAKFIKGLPAEEVPDGRRTSRELAARYPDQDLGPRVIIVDEVQELFTSDDHKDEAAYLCTRLIKKGRAYGIILILLTQNPDAPSLPSSVSSSVGTRLALAVMDWRANNNILGTGAHERGLRATEISVSEQGTGILVRGREGGTVRAAFIKQPEAHSIGQRALALRIAAGTLSGEAAGQEVEVVDTDTIVDHLAAVWPSGEETMHSARLVEALAAFRPDLYASWLDQDQTGRSTTLAAALRPHKVQTRQINKRGDGGGGKGVRWEDLEKALGGDSAPV